MQNGEPSGNPSSLQSRHDTGGNAMVGQNNVVVYKSLQQVWRALTSGPVKDTQEVKTIVNLCHQLGLVNRTNDDVVLKSPSQFRSRVPFVVIEGLDGSGKTTLTKFLKSKLQMELMSTPPKTHTDFVGVRKFFDNQPETIRRAYYSLGNYIAAGDVLKSDRPVVMDRFWHSTVAYALAQERKIGNPVNDADLIWPEDLLKPDLVIFLQLSERERLRRHASRRDFTNTPEEQILAEDEEFRRNLVSYYRGVVGPRFVEVEVDGGYTKSQTNVIHAVLRAFPEMEDRLTNPRYSLRS